MATEATKYSERGQERNTRVDAKALGDFAGSYALTFATGAFTQDSTVTTKGPYVPVDSYVIAAVVGYTQLPAGGTLEQQLAKRAAAGDAVTVIGTANPETSASVVDEGKFLTITGGILITAGDQLQALQVASDDAVGTAQTGGVITVYLRPKNSVNCQFTATP